MESSAKHIVVFSHGFGVRKDDRGLFTAIADGLPNVKTVLFDYFETDGEAHTLTVRPFSEQVDILRTICEKERTCAPRAVIDVVAHSQGCIIAALAQLKGMRKTILIAPPVAGSTDILKRYKNNPKARIDFTGVSVLQRSDGSVTLVPATYWHERMQYEPLVLYNQLAETTDLTLVRANQDNVLGETLFDGLNQKATLMSMDGDHEFSREARVPVVRMIKKLLE